MGSGVGRELDAATGFLPRLTATRFGAGRGFDRAARRALRAGIDRRSFHRYLADARRRSRLFDVVERATTETFADRPLLTVFGARNDPLGFQPEWKARFPHARQVVVPRGYHFPMCDDPGLVAGAVASWHAECVSGSRAAP